MNGHDNLTSLGSSSYSFYLNVVVLKDAPISTMSKHGTMYEAEVANIPPAIPDQINEDEELGEEDGFPSKKTTLSFLKSLSKSSKALKSASSAVGNVATAVIAKSTMLSRANIALSKAIPELISSTELDLTIGKRFQQGPVIVLQVDMKPASLPRYIELIKGKEVADDYCTAVKMLKGLGATKTLGTLEKEVLPGVRRGLMEKFSDDIVRIMHEKDSNQFLDVECIPLEESEEARWLFTFMEFQSQMK